MEWVKITIDNKHTLDVGEIVKFNNGYEWKISELTQFNLDNGFVLTGVHNEVARFINPMFGEYIFVYR